jgi:uncharacterized membrane protein YedE/YeeE
MKNPLTLPRWSPYAVGAGIGVLSWATFLFMDKALGTSTSMVNMAGLIEYPIAPDHVRENAYLAKHVIASPAIDWQMALVVFLVIGSLLAARLSRQRFVEHVPRVWAQRFGENRIKRYAFAFVGGAVLLFGARLAGGCTSGHGISGGLQLALSSWTFFVAMFASGVGAAFLLYRVGASKKGGA